MALANDLANASNKFITNNEVDDKISNIPTGPAIEKHVEVVTSSDSNYHVQKNGKYRIQLCGGGSSGNTKYLGSVPLSPGYEYRNSGAVIIGPNNTPYGFGGDGETDSGISQTPGGDGVVIFELIESA